MRAEQFNQIFEEVMAKSSSVLVKKADEYADDVDRLRNFKKAAHLQSISNRKALSGMMAKHTVSIYDLLSQRSSVSLELWDEKIIDHINYLILLRALVVDELEGEK